MKTPVAILGIALVLVCLAVLCLLSAAGATTVAVITVLAVLIDAFRLKERPLVHAPIRTMDIDLKTR